MTPFVAVGRNNVMLPHIPTQYTNFLIRAIYVLVRNVKYTLGQTTKTQRRSRGVALLYL